MISQYMWPVLSFDKRTIYHHKRWNIPSFITTQLLGEAIIENRIIIPRENKRSSEMQIDVYKHKEITCWYFLLTGNKM